MILRPIRRPQGFVHYGIFVDEYNVIGTWGKTTMFEQIPGKAKIYSHSETRLNELVKEGKGRYKIFNGRITRWQFEKDSVYNLRDALAHLSPEEAFETLQIFVEWVKECGASIGALSTIGESLFRSTLPAPLIISRRKFPLPEKEFCLGGRQEGIAGVYKDIDIWDLKGAYPAKMKEVYAATSYRHYLGPCSLDSVGFARAIVRLNPNFVFGPLPFKTEGNKIVSYPTKGKLEGVWDIQELQLAERLGCDIRILESWIGKSVRLPFTEWSDLVKAGRDLPGEASKLAKMVTNNLWGMFAASGNAVWIHYENDHKIATPDKRELKPACIPLAAHITAAIRKKLFLEALVNPFLIGCHTDSALLPTGYAPSGTLGDGLGEWRPKYHARVLELIYPSAMRLIDLNGEIKYIMAGTPKKYAEKIFETMKKNYLRKHQLDPESWLFAKG